MTAPCPDAYRSTDLASCPIEAAGGRGTMKPYQKQSPTKEEALGKPGALFINFAGAALAYRLRAGAREPLLAALGRRQLNDPPLVDATAGLGRDAFIAAAAGFEVTMIERVPEAHHALAAALERAQ